MKVNNVYAEFEVVRDFSRCINCLLYTSFSVMGGVGQGGGTCVTVFCK